MDELLKLDPEVPNIEPHSDEWDRLAGQVAISHVGRIYACTHCCHPVVIGFKCSFCGSYDPDGLR